MTLRAGKHLAEKRAVKEMNNDQLSQQKTAQKVGGREGKKALTLLLLWAVAHDKRAMEQSCLEYSSPSSSVLSGLSRSGTE